jgi:hypothetical protein
MTLESTVKPLRILLVSAPDPEAGGLDLEGETEELQAILGRNPDIEVSNLDHPDSHGLRRALNRESFHVLHFMGHGVFEAETGEGALLFRDPAGAREVVSGRHLATKLKDFPSVRLVVLNACDTARSSQTSGHDPFSGVASALVLAGVPAVVAMQTPIDDASAIAFSTAFYERLAQGLGVDEALSEGRQALYSLAAEGIAWAIPVLFLRAPSGILFVWRGGGLDTRAELSDPPKRSRRGTSLGYATLLGLVVAYGVFYWTRPFAGLTTVLDGGVGERPPATPGTAVPASAPRRQDSRLETISEGAGELRFYITGAEPSSSFLPALRRSARGLVGSHQFGRALAATTVHLGLSRPAVAEHLQAGLAWRRCQVTVACRIETTRKADDLGPISAVRSHVDSGTACSEASAALAEAVVERLAAYLREAVP